MFSLTTAALAGELRILHAGFPDEKQFTFPNRLAPGTKIILKPRIGGYCFSQQQLSLKIHYRPDFADSAPTIQLEGMGSCDAILTAIVPTNAPLGKAQFLMTVDDESFGPTDVEIVPSRFGQIGTVLHPDNSPVQMTRPAHAAGEVVVLGTGLGTGTPRNLQAALGIQTAAVVDTAAITPGIDMVRLRLPVLLESEGCYVPLTVNSAGESMGSLPVAATQSAPVCPHPLGLAAAQISALDGGRSIALGLLSVTNMHEGTTGFGSAQWSVALEGAAAIRDLLAPSQLGCTAVPSPSTNSPRSYFLDHGDAAVLTGPTGRTLQVRPFATFGYTRDGTPFFTAGVWQFHASGGRDVAAIQTEFSVPQPLSLSSSQPAVNLDDKKSFTLRWTGHFRQRSCHRYVQQCSDPR
ncbi:MAG: hypothetical protein HY820_07440 [Acidobacteria bacterium]|nr:hypothetical protein [Acidobacteriota bacterium]